MSFFKDFDVRDAAFIMGFAAMVLLALAAGVAIKFPAAATNSIFQMVTGQFIGLLQAAVIFFFKGGDKQKPEEPEDGSKEG